ncbi:MAG TPA: acyl-CoA dehydrogenase family protein [Pseudonocardiaceae bacterium]|jgi:alkylation response protein AidB-like acyl-CoA dehydrogenase|nr:acyl-CoA dehydrogenase family protein [Pseudonocardiaceae bacterium]
MDLAAPHYLTESSHEALRKQVRDFADSEVAPRVAEMEAERVVQGELSRRIARQGWIGATIPRRYGGMGAGHLAKTIIIEELARVSGAMGAMVQASQLGVAKILHFGTQKQKDTWLPRIADGTCLPTIAVTERTSGGHVLGMTGTAERHGDEYVLNGEKVFVGNSHVGDLHGVVLRTGPRRRDVTAFLVDSNRPGCSVGDHRPRLGLHGFSFGELKLVDCRVPVDCRLGDEGDGWKVAYSSSILYGRPNLTAVALGIHQALVDETRAYARTQHRYGAPLHQVSTVNQRLGAMWSSLMTCRTVAYLAASMLDRGEACDPELINAKLVNTTELVNSALAAKSIHGATALETDRPIERLIRDALHVEDPAGTPDIQRLRLAEFALGTDKGQQWSEMFPGDGDADIDTALAN